MLNAEFWVNWKKTGKDFFNLELLDLELELKFQTHAIIENDSVEENDAKTLSAKVVGSILTDLLTKIPIKDEFSGDIKEKPSEGMHTYLTLKFSSQIYSDSIQLTTMYFIILPFLDTFSPKVRFRRSFWGA